MSNGIIIPPVRLFIGEIEAVRAAMVKVAGETFAFLTECSNDGLGSTHSALRWILPSDKAYRRDDLEPFFEEVYRSRTEKQPVFFLLPSVDLLNDSCANSMLKVLEEPPRATYFLLGAPCVDFVLPTIVSRSVMVTVSGKTDSFASVLVAHFMSKTPQNHAQFIKLIEEEDIDERKTRVLLDILSEQLQEAFNTSLTDGDAVAMKKAEKALRVISYAYGRLPMPGSTKTFWRTIYMLMG